MIYIVNLLLNYVHITVMYDPTPGSFDFSQFLGVSPPADGDNELNGGSDHDGYFPIISRTYSQLFLSIHPL